jgi:hypothetical protein
VLSLGFRGPFGGAIYDLFYEHAPGWQAVRTPGRLTTLSTLALAILAALGAQWLASRVTSKPGIKVAICALAAVVVALEGAGRVPLYVMPPVPAGQIGAPDPQLHLPSDVFHDLLYMYWSTEGFPRIANGHGVFDPESIVHLRRATRRFPDAASVQALQDAGIRTVILHPGYARRSPWRFAADAPVAGLPLTRVEKGDVVLFEIEPGSG